VAKVAVQCFTRTKVYHWDNFKDAVLNRPKGKGLITASNHSST